MRFSPLVAAAAALALLTLAPSSCSGVGEDTPNGKSSSKAEPKRPPGVAPIATKGKCKAVGELEGAFTKSSEMADYLACIVPGIEQWIDAAYPDMSSPKYYFVPAGTKGIDNKCEYDDATLAYCTTTRSVFFGEVATFGLYKRHGDAAGALVMAHEVTHHFQKVAAMPPAQVASEQIRYENQADCGAGAFISYANKQKWLNPADDIIDVAGALALAGAIPGTKNRTHGSAPERLAAFGRAVISSDPNPLRTCNRFVPEVALVG